MKKIREKRLNAERTSETKPCVLSRNEKKASKAMLPNDGTVWKHTSMLSSKIEKL